ncbi:MAG: MoaD/ThiS family protein [Desulfovibrio sp.]|jgi:molybdopterin converting factor small subunit|nr:MoaD/ThiS family protein [Desulfovibrio sp.]
MMIPVTVDCRLVWRKAPPREVMIPEGTTIDGFLDAIGEGALRGQALLAIDRQICNPDRVVRAGETVMLLPVMCGG